MKIIKLYEEFTNKTLSINNDEYDEYFNKNKGSTNGEMVAWESDGSQEKNFNIVSKHIKNGDSLLDYGCGVGDLIKYLNKNNILIKDYLGVDINSNYIKYAKDNNHGYNFKLINNINQINGKYDTVVAIGVFTWYITQNEFIESIYKLYDTCNKQVILSLLEGDTPYDDDEYDEDSENEYWEDEYRYYSEKLFYDLFPSLKFSFECIGTTLLVKITK